MAMNDNKSKIHKLVIPRRDGSVSELLRFLSARKDSIEDIVVVLSIKNSGEPCVHWSDQELRNLVFEEQFLSKEVSHRMEEND